VSPSLSRQGTNKIKYTYLPFIIHSSQTWSRMPLSPFQWQYFLPLLCTANQNTLYNKES
jgi:hypothetical protein